MRLRIPTDAIRLGLLACGCGLALVLAVWVRFLPAERAGDPIVFRADSAFHFRMLTSMIRDGKLPENDPLFYQEPPRFPAHLYPPNLYIFSAAVIEIVRKLNCCSLGFVGLFFLLNSLCGTLPVIGTGWLMWEVSGGKPNETVLGMIFCAIATPMVLRSHAGIFRHETLAVGLLLIFAGILLHGIRRGYRPFWYCMAVICVFVGMGFWRLFPSLAAMIILGILVAELFSKDTFGLGSAIDVSAVACLMAAFAYPFYRAHILEAGLYSSPLLMMPAIHRLSRLPSISKWKERLRPTKLGILAVVITVMLIGSLVIPVLRVRWLAAFTTGPLPLTSATLYGVLVEELAPLPLSQALSDSFFLYLPVMLIGSFILLRGRCMPTSLHQAVVSIFLIFMTLTLFFVRFVCLAFPFMIICLIPALSIVLEKWKNDLPGRLGWIRVQVLVLLFLVPALGFYLREDLRLSKYLLQPDLDQVAAFTWLKLKGNATQQANVVSDWSHGFEIQTFAGLPTVTDGYLEDPRNRARILALLRALFSTEEADLVSYMEKYNGGYIFLDRVYLVPICRRLNLPWREWFDIQQQEEFTRLTLKTSGKRNNYLKCLFDPKSLKAFRVAFNSGNYVVLRREPMD